MTGYNTASAPSPMTRALATTDATGTSFFLHDANKNVMQRTDAEGDLLEKYEYAPFGGNTGEARAGVGFSSEAFDAATDLDYYNYRYYAPGLGRWTKRDPIGELSYINLYSMVSNCSVIYVDGLGLHRLKLFYDLENMQNPFFTGDSIAREKYGNYQGLLNAGFTVLPEKRGDYFWYTEDVLIDIEKRVKPYHPKGIGNCNCIEHIQFAQHGSPGILRLGEDSLVSSTLEKWDYSYKDYKYPSKNLDKKETYYSGMLDEENINQRFNSFLSRISALLCTDGKVYVDFIQCNVAQGNSNGAFLMDYLETFFNANVTVRVYRTPAYLFKGKALGFTTPWTRYGKPVKERR